MGEVEKKCCDAGSKCCNGKKTLFTLLKVIFGLALLVLGGWLTLKYWEALVSIFKGCIGLFLILAGVIALAIAKE
jgi:hypothetical protein